MFVSTVLQRNCWFIFEQQVTPFCFQKWHYRCYQNVVSKNQITPILLHGTCYFPTAIPCAIQWHESKSCFVLMKNFSSAKPFNHPRHHYTFWSTATLDVSFYQRGAMELEPLYIFHHLMKNSTQTRPGDDFVFCAVEVEQHDVVWCRDPVLHTSLAPMLIKWKINTTWQMQRDEGD